MGDNLQKELDVDLSGVNIKIQTKHPKSVELVEKVSEMLRNVGIPPSKFADLRDSCLYLFSQINNEDVCIAFIIWFIWAFLLDDHLDQNSQDFSKWYNILEGDECLGDGTIEKLYQLFLKVVNIAFTTKSFNELSCITKNWLENFETLQQLSNDEIYEISDKKFIETRMLDVAALPCFYFVQIDATLEVTEELASDENWKKLRYNTILQLTIINDLFSFKKEVKIGQHKKNFVYVKMKNHILSAQQAVEQLCAEAENAEKMAHYHGKKLKESYDIKGLCTYVDGLLNAMVGNIYWSSISKRYNDI